MNLQYWWKSIEKTGVCTPVFFGGIKTQKNHSFTMKEWLGYSLYFYDFQVFST